MIVQRLRQQNGNFPVISRQTERVSANNDLKLHPADFQDFNVYKARAICPDPLQIRKSLKRKYIRESPQIPASGLVSKLGSLDFLNE